jgi:hypothetical protein
VEVQLHAFLTSTPDGSEWSASRPGRFILTQRAPLPRRHPLDKRLGGLQSRSGRGGEEEILSRSLVIAILILYSPERAIIVGHHHCMAHPPVTDGRDGLQIWRIAAKIQNMQSRTADNV